MEDVKHMFVQLFCNRKIKAKYLKRKKIKKYLVVEKNIVILHSHLERCLLEVKSGNSSVGRAQPCQGWGREFESRFPLFIS